jgi:predicted nucleic acid-binding protein
MNDKVFLDTNLLVYLQSGMDATRYKAVQQLFRAHASEHMIVLSTQVLQEFYVAMTRKLNHDPLTIKSIMTLLMDFEIVQIQPAHILEAVDISILHRISFWDSLLVSAAVSAHCRILYTEDINPEQRIQGVRIVNPFMKV